MSFLHIFIIWGAFVCIPCAIFTWFLFSIIPYYVFDMCMQRQPKQKINSTFFSSYFFIFHLGFIRSNIFSHSFLKQTKRNLYLQSKITNIYKQTRNETLIQLIKHETGISILSQTVAFCFPFFYFTLFLCMTHIRVSGMVYVFFVVVFFPFYI